MNTGISEPIHIIFCSQGQKINIQHRHENAPASDHELLFFGFGTDLGVDVHGEECAGAVKDGSE